MEEGAARHVLGLPAFVAGILFMAEGLLVVLATEVVGLPLGVVGLLAVAGAVLALLPLYLRTGSTIRSSSVGEGSTSGIVPLVLGAVVLLVVLEVKVDIAAAYQGHPAIWEGLTALAVLFLYPLVTAVRGGKLGSLTDLGPTPLQNTYINPIAPYVLRRQRGGWSN